MGWSNEALSEISNFCRQIGSEALFVSVGGKQLWSWGGASHRIIVQSARKSILATMFGALVADGRVDLSATLDAHGIDDLDPSLTEEEKQATIEHLLQSRSGIYHVAAAQEFSGMPERGVHGQGERFVYNNWDFNVAGTVFEQASGMTVYEGIDHLLARPIGMQDYTLKNALPFAIPGSMHIAYHVAMSARDLARLGILVARKGRWGKTQVIPDSWIEQMTTVYSHDAMPNFQLDYGYMWWIGRAELLGGFPYFAALGGHGHTLWVVPALDLVVVHRNPLVNKVPNPNEVFPILGMVVDARLDAVNKPNHLAARRADPPDDWLHSVTITPNGDTQRVEASPYGLTIDVPNNWRIARPDVNRGERLMLVDEGAGTFRCGVFRRASSVADRVQERKSWMDEFGFDVNLFENVAFGGEEGTLLVGHRQTGPCLRHQREWFISRGGDCIELRLDGRGLASSPAGLFDKIASTVRLFDWE